MVSLSTKASVQKYIKEQREYRVKYTQTLHEKIKDLGNQEQAVLAGQSVSDLDVIYKELKHNVTLLKKIKGKMMFKPLAVKEDCYEDLNAIQIALTNKLGFKPSMAMTISHVAKEFKRKNKKLFGIVKSIKE